MTENYCKPLAEILRKAQGVIDENGEPVDIGGEVQQVRSICDRLASLEREHEQLREGIRELADDFDSQYEDMRGAEHAISKECGQRLRDLLGED